MGCAAWSQLWEALDNLLGLGIHKKLGLGRSPSPASISRWKKTLANQASFYMLARSRKLRRLLAIIDRTVFKLDKASSHYVKRVRKKRNYVSLTTIYSLKIDAFFPTTVTSDSISEFTALREYLLGSIADAKIFWGLLGDKRFDPPDIITRREALGIVAIIPTRMEMLKPKSDLRLGTSLAYRSFIKRVGNFIESAFASLKSLAQDFVRGVSWEARICNVYVFAWLIM